MVRTMGARKEAGEGPRKRVSLLKLLRDYPDLHVQSSQAEDAPEKTLSLEISRSKCREWAQRLDDNRRIATAAQFTFMALQALATELQIDATLTRHLSACELDREATELAHAIGRESAKLPRIEALHFVTSLYPALLPQQTRSKLGAFYTPPALTRRLIHLLSEHGVDWATARVLDPATGAGAFLLQVASRMVSEFEGTEPSFVLKQLGARIRGLEIDPNAASLAQASLEMLLADVIRSAGQPAPQFIRVCDSLEEDPTEHFDVVVGNPPYGRVSLSPEQRSRFARSLYGHANLYGVFTDLALRWTKRGGVIAYVTPTSFLAGRYFAALRELLATEAPPVSIDFLHARKGIFEDVLQETLLAVYRKDGRPTRVQIHYLNVNPCLEATVTRNGTVALPALPDAPWLAPRSPQHGPLIAHAERMPSRLGDWGYSVSTGPLVWNRFKSQLCTQFGSSTLPLVWAECVLPDGSFEFRARKRNHTPFFRVQAGDEWLVVKRPCVLVQRTTAKEQPRRLIAAELPAAFIEKHGGVVVENHLNMIWPNELARVDPAVVAALLNSDVVDQLFRCMNGSVAVSAFELSALPLPATDALSQLTALVCKGAHRALIEAECRRLYLEVP